ncbi:MAG: hypothetical protein K6E94_06900 [Elusimicrobiaceae bacterium]|nr:hypothetical protein [Elusimicrobiaceae bacterium]
MTEENQAVETAETCNTQKKCCLCHKLLGLKGLSNIYKALSIIVILVMLYILGSGWYEIIKTKLPITEGLLWTLQIVITYLFYALLLFTIARVLKVLKKIKHAVNNK